MAIKVLLVGESWMSNMTHYKGWDLFTSSYYETGGDYWINAVEVDKTVKVDFMPNHDASTDFPSLLTEFEKYDVIVLSDIGANTLLLHPDTFIHGKRTVNRLSLLEEWVSQGGSLVMAGGYLSFQGIQGSASYHGTKVEDILPVNIFPYDDRLEIPEGSIPKVVTEDHPILTSIDNSWPFLLGLNKVAAKEGAEVILEAEGYPLLVAGEYGKGRSVAWTTDIGPHWCPEEFLNWNGFGKLWHNILKWCVKKL